MNFCEPWSIRCSRPPAGLPGAWKGHRILCRDLQFCLLAYRPRGLALADSKSQTAVWLVIREEKGRLRLLVHPEWRNIVEGRDIDYLESLIEDFRERAIIDPDALFKHISSLGVGPIIAQETGQILNDHPLPLELSSKFVNL